MLSHLIEELPQLIVNGLVVGTILALPAIGFTAIYAVLRFPNFTVASHATMGAYAGFVANVWLGLPIVPSLALAFIIPAISGLLCDEYVLKPLRRTSAATGPMAAAIAAVALTIALENVIRFVFGNDLRGYDLPVYRDWRFDSASPSSASGRSRWRTRSSRSLSWQACSPSSPSRARER